MKIKCYFLILTFILIFSCRPVVRSIYEFDPRTIKEEEFTLSEIADDISYIPLDNIFPLGRIPKTVIIKNAIYINPVNTGLLRYDREGRFLNKIGKIGRGPGEYINYMHFCVDDKTGKVFNVSNRNELIQVFSGNGEFIRSYLLKDYGTGVENVLFYNSQLFVQCIIEWKDTDYEWIIYDTTGSIIKKRNRHLPKFDTNSSGAGYPYIFEDKLTYYNNWTDTIFSILPDLEEIPSMIMNPGEHRFPRAYVPINQIMQKKYFSLSRIFETKRFIIIKYYYQKYSIAFIDKQNRKVLLNYHDWDEGVDGHQIGGIINDLDGGLRFIPDSYFAEDDREYLVGMQYPIEIKAHANRNEFKNSYSALPMKKLEFERLAKSLEETDNPILVLVKLKK